VSESPTEDPADGAGRLVLVVEDEPQVLRFLRASLGAHGYRLVEATTGRQALVEAATRTPDLVLLDLGLPDMDGVDVARRLREWSTVPVIVLSARGQENDKIRALDAGADDYLTKPFGVGELLARMRVALRHATRVAAGGGDSALETGDLRVDLAARRVFLKGEEVRLTRTEFNLLATLAKHAGKVLTHRQLLRQVWGVAYEAE
jgi:two-component system KDP operon response regulator KdpE